MNSIDIKYTAAISYGAAFQNMNVVPDHPVALRNRNTANMDS
jgi:hypothetical protein